MAEQGPYHRFVLDRPCPKCGVRGTPSRHCVQRTRRAWTSVYSRIDFHPDVPEGDHLHRKCLHCGFERIELARDAVLLSDEERARLIAQFDEERSAYVEHMREALADA